jgi:hypothetical protein
MSLILGLLTLTVLLWIWPILYLTVSFLYRSATIGARSATLGMRLMNIELRNGLGQRSQRRRGDDPHRALPLPLGLDDPAAGLHRSDGRLRAGTRVCTTTSSAALRSTAPTVTCANQRRKNGLQRGPGLRQRFGNNSTGRTDPCATPCPSRRNSM